MQNNRSVVIFLTKFFGVYALLFVAYSLYLNKTQEVSHAFACSPITKLVANQTQFLLKTMGYHSSIQQHPEELSIQLFVASKYVGRIIEGCNSISIIILFISFIVAFAGQLKPTLLYILFGSLLIYSVNIIRIAFIGLALYKYPQYQHVLHVIIFPAIIYGITFLLWVIWVRYFSKINR